MFRPSRISTSDHLKNILTELTGLTESEHKNINTIDLSSAPFDVRSVVATQIARIVFETNFWNSDFGKHPVCLVAEEAHAYAPASEHGQFSGSREAIERIAKEGRKYGVSLGLVSQRPHELTPTALAQCGTFICLRTTNPEDQAYLRRMMPEGQAGLLGILSSLQPGEAVILGDAVSIPMRVTLDSPSPTPDSNDIDFGEVWRTAPESVDLDRLVTRWRSQTSARSGDA
jgi:DNA helicase HerA-like ATPase